MGKPDSVFSRLKAIIDANINAMLDKVTDPEKMLNAWVRKSHVVLAQAKDEMVNARQKVVEYGDLIRELENEADAYRDSAKLALDNNDEDTAKACLTKEFRFRKKADLYRVEQAHYQGLAEKLMTYVERAQVKVDSIEMEAERLKEEYRVAVTQSDVMEMNSKLTSTDFDQSKTDIQRKTRQKKARAQVLEEIETTDTDAKIAKYRDQLEFDPDKALEALKEED